MKIRLKTIEARTFQGIFSYLVAYDNASGRKDRYTVFVLNPDDPIIIGRELPLDAVRELISDYEEAGASRQNEIYEGDRRALEAHLLACMAQVTKKRRQH